MIKKFMNKEFLVEKFTNFDGSTVVSYIEQGGPFVAKAYQQGIAFTGVLEIGTGEELQDFARMVSSVWTEHKKLKPRIEAP